MFKSPLVSIVLPTRNREAYLSLAIEGCLSQTYQNFELWIVNDASTDGTTAVATAYAERDPRVKVISNAVNLGMSDSLNLGFSKASGTYYTWTSDDNIHDPEALAVMVNTLVKHPSMDITFCDFRTFDQDGAAIGTVVVQGGKNIDHTSTLGACFLYKRAVHDILGGYDAKVDCANDINFWLQSFRRFKIIKTSGIAPYRYRLHPTSITSSRATEVFLTVCLLRKKHLVPLGNDRVSLIRGYMWHLRRKFLRQAPSRAVSLAFFIKVGLCLAAYLAWPPKEESIELFRA